jgi:hypothetical protein
MRVAADDDVVKLCGLRTTWRRSTRRSTARYRVSSNSKPAVSTWWAAVDSNHLPPRYSALSAVFKIRRAERKGGCYVAWESRLVGGFPAVNHLATRIG